MLSALGYGLLASSSLVLGAGLGAGPTVARRARSDWCWRSALER